MRTVIVVPTYNERENIGPLCGEVHRITEGDVDILIVDDNSPDGTGEAADRMARECDSILVIHRADKQGLGRAYVAGFRWALDNRYDLIVQMDADLSHNPVYLPLLIETASAGKVAVGSRYVKGGGVSDWNWRRVFLSKAANRYVGLILRMPIHDATGGYRSYPREALIAIGLDNLFSNGYAFQVETAYRLFQSGFELVEIPIVFADRKLGCSKLDSKVIWEAIRTPWRLRIWEARKWLGIKPPPLIQ